MGIGQMQMAPAMKSRRESQVKISADENDPKKLRKIWKSVEEDSAYFGFSMCTV